MTRWLAARERRRIILHDNEAQRANIFHFWLPIIADIFRDKKSI